jgi:uncharacterized OB-fold protein
MATEQDAPPRPSPAVDEESAFYWDGLAEGRLLLQRCDACSTPRFPAMPSCPYCADPATSVFEASGEGAVYSWIVVHRAFHPAFAGDVPYTVAMVDLDEGPRVVAWLQDVGEPRPGLPVTATYVDHPEGFSELRFTGKEA